MKTTILILTLLFTTTTWASRYQLNEEVELRYQSSLYKQWEVVLENNSMVYGAPVLPMNFMVAERLADLDKKKTYTCTATYFKKGMPSAYSEIMVYQLLCQ